MKNFKLLLIILLTIGISSCKKDETKKPDALASIVGKWQFKANTQTSYKNGVKQDEYTEFADEGSAEFTSDGKAIIDKSNYTYKIAGNNRLLLTYPGETEPEEDLEITKLTANELALSKEESDTTKKGDIFKTVTQFSFNR